MHINNKYKNDEIQLPLEEYPTLFQMSASNVRIEIFLDF